MKEATEIRERIYENEKWINDYLSKRENYPKWTTRDGRQISVGDITDSHLENLLNFVPRGNVWHQVFTCEKLYRKLKEELPNLKRANIECNKVMDLCY